MPIIAQLTITGQNQWTTPVHLLGWFNASVSNTAGGSLGGTRVTAQRSWDYSPDNPGAATWYDVDYWVRTAEDVGFEPDLVWYTIGVKTGDYVSTCKVAFSLMGSMRS